MNNRVMKLIRKYAKQEGVSFLVNKFKNDYKTLSAPERDKYLKDIKLLIK